MKQPSHRYILSFQAERSYRGRRYYWTICREDKPDELVSWGYAPTQELAKATAQKELKTLSSGMTKSGRVKRYEQRREVQPSMSPWHNSPQITPSRLILTKTDPTPATAPRDK